jgi:methylated-DNA-protein-cysteine methyltransferase-like protein
MATDARDAERARALRAVWAVVAAIPRGSTLAYGEVARRARMPRRARWIGRALGEAPRRLRLPWHRVIGAANRIAFPAGSSAHREQAARLRAEGLTIRGRQVIDRRVPAHRRDLDAWLWKPDRR